jgi:ribosomal protein S18 acetylase RimI-like enzyme
MKNGPLFAGQTPDGRNYLIRYPEITDAGAMCDYINILSQECTFITFQGEQLSLEEETKYLENRLKKISENKAVNLLVVAGHQIIGVSDITLKDKTSSHEGVLGITILKEFRGQGIGKTLMGLVLKEAESHLPELRLVTLSVFGNNPLAYGMYQKFGFTEYGRLPAGVLHKGNYVDHVYMYKQIR